MYGFLRLYIYSKINQKRGDIMPIIGYKKQFDKIPFLKDDIFTINFNLKYHKNGSLEFENANDKYFDCGNYHLLIDKVFDNFDMNTYKQYDNGIMILSICKYLVDNISNIYSIVHEDKATIDTYYKEEVIESYNNYNEYRKKSNQ